MTIDFGSNVVRNEGKVNFLFDQKTLLTTGDQVRISKAIEEVKLKFPWTWIGSKQRVVRKNDKNWLNKHIKHIKDENSAENKAPWGGQLNTGGSCSIFSAQWIYRKNNDHKLSLEDYLAYGMSGELKANMLKSVTTGMRRYKTTENGEYAENEEFGNIQGKRDSMDLTTTTTFLDRLKLVVRDQESKHNISAGVSDKTRQIITKKPGGPGVDSPVGYKPMHIKRSRYQGKHIAVDDDGDNLKVPRMRDLAKNVNESFRSVPQSFEEYCTKNKHLNKYFLYITFGASNCKNDSRNGHAVAASIDHGNKLFQFFDSNYGECEFNSEEKLIKFFREHFELAYLQQKLTDYIYMYAIK